MPRIFLPTMGTEFIINATIKELYQPDRLPIPKAPDGQHYVAETVTDVEFFIQMDGDVFRKVTMRKDDIMMLAGAITSIDQKAPYLQDIDTEIY